MKGRWLILAILNYAESCAKGLGLDDCGAHGCVLAAAALVLHSRGYKPLEAAEQIRGLVEALVFDEANSAVAEEERKFRAKHIQN